MVNFCYGGCERVYWLSVEFFSNNRRASDQNSKNLCINGSLFNFVELNACHQKSVLN